MKRILYIVILTLSVYGCKGLPPVVSFDGTDIKVNSSDNIKHSVYYSYIGLPFEKVDFSKSTTINIHNFLAKDEKNRFSIAYEYSQNNSLPIKVRVDNCKDTTLQYSFPLFYQEDSLYCQVISGPCLPFARKSESNNTQQVVKKWLYNNNKPSESYQIWIMSRIYDSLSGSELTEYSAPSEAIMPVSNSIEGERYSLLTNMRADKYYLLATGISSQTDSLTSATSLIINTDSVEQFIAEEVSHDFPKASSSPDKLICHLVESPRTTVLLLVGINSDWSKQILPVGVLANDRNGPFQGVSLGSGGDYDYLLGDGRLTYASPGEQWVSKGYKIAVNMPKRFPVTEGLLSISWGDFQGYGYYSIPFTVSFSGDTKSVKIDGKEYSLSGKKSPYSFSHSMSLRTGDNNIEIVAKDLRGNENSFYIHIKMSTIKD